MTHRDEVAVISLNRGDPLFDQVEQLFKLQMEHLADKGMLIPMQHGGERVWRVEMERAAGRTGVVLVAVQGGEVIAFLYGLLRVLPAYLGGEKCATMPQFHVKLTHRSSGIGRMLFDEFVKWCRARNCSSIETYVVPDDHHALAVWKRLGFMLEHQQIRKAL